MLVATADNLPERCYVFLLQENLFRGVFEFSVYFIGVRPFQNGRAASFFFFFFSFYITQRKGVCARAHTHTPIHAAIHAAINL